METFEDFARDAVDDARSVVGPMNLTNHAVAMSMLRMLHSRVVVLEVAAKPAEAHAPGDAADPR